jgi:hypothetical protein
VHTVVGWITRHPDALTEEETTHLKAVFDVCPELDQTHELVRDFAQMLAQPTGADLPDWISSARATRQSARQRFGRCGSVKRAV